MGSKDGMSDIYVKGNVEGSVFGNTGDVITYNFHGASHMNQPIFNDARSVKKTNNVSAHRNHVSASGEDADDEPRSDSSHDENHESDGEQLKEKDAELAELRARCEKLGKNCKEFEQESKDKDACLQRQEFALMMQSLMAQNREEAQADAAEQKHEELRERVADLEHASQRSPSALAVKFRLKLQKKEEKQQKKEKEEHEKEVKNAQLGARLAALEKKMATQGEHLAEQAEEVEELEERVSRWQGAYMGLKKHITDLASLVRSHFQKKENSSPAAPAPEEDHAARPAFLMRRVMSEEPPAPAVRRIAFLRMAPQKPPQEQQEAQELLRLLHRTSSEVSSSDDGDSSLNNFEPSVSSDSSNNADRESRERAVRELITQALKDEKQ